MKVEIKTIKTYDVKYIAFNIPIYYGDLNWSEKDNEFCNKYYSDANGLSIKIDIETGIVTDWAYQELNDVFSIYAKVRDEGTYKLYDDQHNEIVSYQGYVPDILSCVDEGYGDYLSMNISPDGRIDKWNSSKLNLFIESINEE